MVDKPGVTRFPGLRLLAEARSLSRLVVLVAHEWSSTTAVLRSRRNLLVALLAGSLFGYAEVQPAGLAFVGVKFLDFNVVALKSVLGFIVAIFGL